MTSMRPTAFSTDLLDRGQAITLLVDPGHIDPHDCERHRLAYLTQALTSLDALHAEARSGFAEHVHDLSRHLVALDPVTRPIAFPVARVMAAACATVRPCADLARVALLAGETELEICGDAPGLVLMLTALLHEALGHCDPGDVISVAATGRGGDQLWSVQSTARRASRGSRGGAAAQSDLVLAHRVARAHGGLLRVERGDGGTLMTVFFEERELADAVAAMSAAPSGGHDRAVALALAGITHDVRGALAVILGLSEIAARNLARGCNEPAIEPVRHMDRVAGRVAALCDDMLECARRLELRTSDPLALETTDLAEVVRRCVHERAGEFARAGCGVRVQAPDSLVQRSHRRSLERVLDNLLRNALQHGAGNPIVVSLQGEENRVCLSVRDHGPGMSTAAMSRLFRPYATGAREEGRFRNFGLGLWIVANLVESLGGRVRVESEAGQGTCFTLELPASEPPEARS